MAKALNKKESFAFDQPGASAVLLVGDFTNWQENPIPLKRQKSGVWKTTVSLAPGSYNYRFLVDGKWCDDPACQTRIGNPFGEQNCVRVVA